MAKTVTLPRYIRILVRQCLVSIDHKVIIVSRSHNAKCRILRGNNERKKASGNHCLHLQLAVVIAGAATKTNSSTRVSRWTCAMRNGEANRHNPNLFREKLAVKFYCLWGADHRGLVAVRSHFLVATATRRRAMLRGFQSQTFCRMANVLTAPTLCLSLLTLTINKVPGLDSHAK